MYLPEILGWEFSTWSLWSLTHPCSCSYDKYMVTKITNLVEEERKVITLVGHVHFLLATQNTVW